MSEFALRQQLRPVLVHSQLDDPEQKIMFQGEHWVRVPGSGAVVEHDDGIVYLSLSLRNVGTGIGVLLGWYPKFDSAMGEPAPADDFRHQTRDLYIPAGGIGLWQGALRDTSEELHGIVRDIAENPRLFLIDLLYSDHVGSQRTISRFSVIPMEDGRWMSAVVRHWQLDA